MSKEKNALGDEDFLDPAAEAKRKQQMEWLLSHPVSRKAEPEERKEHGRKPPETKPRRQGEAEEADEDVDLHGLGVEEAAATVELHIESLRRLGLRRLRIIHGGGSVNARDTVKGMVYWKLKSAWGNRVASYKIDPRNPGATLLTLKP